MAWASPGSPQTPLGELTALPQLYLDFRGPTSKGRGKDGREGERMVIKKREGKGRGKEGE